MYRLACILISSLIMLLACRKDRDTLPPEIVFHSPINHGSTQTGDTLLLKLTIRDDKRLGGYEFNMIELDILRKPVDTVWQHSKEIYVGREYDLESYIVPHTDTLLYYELRLDTYDAAGNTFSKSIFQHIAP